MLLITAFFSSILALIFYKLSINVIRLRRKYKVSLGSSKKHKDLEQAIRAHGNLSEFLPIGLILLACLEVNHLPKIVVFMCGLFFLIGRYLHATSFLKGEIDSSNRVLGMKITHWSIILMAILNIITVIVRVIL
ncbi:MAPEG family protein [Methylophilaceae bacterium]|nr:MAPEG family protein [Methylophilaceae bacterium]